MSAARLRKHRPQPEKHIAYFALLEALAKPGCAFCRRQEEAARRSLESLLYEMVNDGSVRARLRRSGGFCREHARMAAATGDALGLTIIYADLLAQWMELGGEAHPDRCPACEAAERSGRLALELCRDHFEDAQLQQALDHADPQCAHHFAELLSLLPKGRLREQLRAWEKAKLRTLRGEMEAFVDKSHHGQQGERISAREGRAWQAAMEFFVGRLSETESDGTVAKVLRDEQEE
jgi:hypothetical protein